MCPAEPHDSPAMPSARNTAPSRLSNHLQPESSKIPRKDAAMQQSSTSSWMDLQCSHFLYPALVALCAAEASLEKCLNQLPGQCWPNHLSAQRKDIHVVVLNSLVSREDIVDKPSAHSSYFIGADGCAYAAAAEHDSAIHCARGQSG